MEKRRYNVTYFNLRAIKRRLFGDFSPAYTEQERAILGL
jgi:hypothetical protein